MNAARSQRLEWSSPTSSSRIVTTVSSIWSRLPAFALRPSNGQEQVPEVFVLSEKVFFSSGDDSRRDSHSLLPGHGQPKQEPILPEEAEQPKPPAVTADQPMISSTAGEVDSVEEDRTKM